MSKSDSTPPPTRGFLFRLSATVDTFLRTCFFQLGYIVAGNPFKTILISVLLMALTLLGMLRFRTESRAEELWVPQGTIALKNQVYVQANYGRTFRTSSIAFRARSNAISLASRDGFLAMLDVASTGFAVEADRGDGVDPLTFANSCVETTDSNGETVCSTVSAFNLFYDVDFVQRKNGKVDFFETVRAKINTLSDADIRSQLENPKKEGFDGSPFNADEILGGVDGSGATYRVTVMRYTQIADNNAIVDSGEIIDRDANKLEENWTELLLETSPLLVGRQIDWFTESSFSQEESLSEALSGDVPLLSAGFVFLGIYVIFFLGDFHAVRSHMLLALGALATTGLALGVCFGLSSAFGLFYGPVHQILPLLIIGIGIDDCFHITRTVDDINSHPSHKDKPLRLRIALALSKSGTAVTVTSFTNTVVFLLSAISELPALRFFAIWAAIGVFAAWGFAVTFYTALITLDSRRIDSKRRDCCPCFAPLAEVKELNWFKKPAGGFSRFFGDQYGPFIMRPVVRIVLLGLFAAMFAAGAYGTSQLFLKFRFAFFYPSGSAQREFQDVIDDYFQLGDPTNIYIRDRDLSTALNQRRLWQLCESETGLIAQNIWIQDDTVDCWLSAFREDFGATGNDVVDPGIFVDKLKLYLNGAGARYKESILFNSDETEITGCRFLAQYVYRETNVNEVDALDSVRETADSVGFGFGEDNLPVAFPYIFLDTFTEQYAALPQEIGLSLGLASVAVAIVCLILVGHPIVALVCVLVVGLVIIDILGLTNFSGVNLNSVSVITLVLCTGISVDFIVHIARSFLEQVGTRDERAIESLRTMGPPVFYAGFSTFVAIIILSGAKSYIFRVLFLGFLFLTVMGFLHGLILTPLILSLVGPPSFYASEADKEKAEKILEERVTGGTTAEGKHATQEAAV